MGTITCTVCCPSADCALCHCVSAGTSEQTDRVLVCYEETVFVTVALKECRGFPSIYQAYILLPGERKSPAPNSVHNRKYSFIHLESGQEKQSGDVHSQEARRDGRVSFGAQCYCWVI